MKYKGGLPVYPNEEMRLVSILNEAGERRHGVMFRTHNFSFEDENGEMFVFEHADVFLSEGTLTVQEVK